MAKYDNSSQLRYGRIIYINSFGFCCECKSEKHHLCIPICSDVLERFSQGSCACVYRRQQFSIDRLIQCITSLPGPEKASYYTTNIPTHGRFSLPPCQSMIHPMSRRDPGFGENSFALYRPLSKRYITLIPEYHTYRTTKLLNGLTDYSACVARFISLIYNASA